MVPGRENIGNLELTLNLYKKNSQAWSLEVWEYETKKMNRQSTSTSGLCSSGCVLLKLIASKYNCFNPILGDLYESFYDLNTLKPSEIRWYNVGKFFYTGHQLIVRQLTYYRNKWLILSQFSSKWPKCWKKN